MLKRFILSKYYNWRIGRAWDTNDAARFNRYVGKLDALYQKPGGITVSFIKIESDREDE